MTTDWHKAGQIQVTWPRIDEFGLSFLYDAQLD